VARSLLFFGCRTAQSDLLYAGLVHFVLRELRVEPQHRDAVGVDDVRIDLAVGVLVRDHLAAAGEVHGGPVEAAVVVLERLAVAADAVEALDAAHEAEAGRAAASAAELDVIAARKIELLVVQPPRHVEMRAAGAVFVVGDSVLHLRDVPRHAEAG